ncbi:D-alanyl-D-alanine carboxypeptidase family protein [Glaciimonas immobilis]|uniref:serine-type D-Ala-D-Ala carboxypeptidase n=1 Tax=Glaciimonas immobilis TaxID=728004 RepID=A0A840RNL4_9BURK|nr:D-alanyl-D-alanine carboxypeptidase family protein [Glaciimonas immobilis]KAF3998920.1 D-alanyl-D-alanine carboxypeptidase [Glaciimonas immobilis]MBB5198324.1 D-alanyl-D-alanine carboxypeptidase (penicillin-binding protein 5/6) [Glaciimonas immobilis]
MKKISAIIVLNYFLLASAFAQTSSEPVLTARSWLLLDTNSDQILTAHDQDKRVEPASLVKLMTGYLACAAIAEKKISMLQMVNVSNRAWKVDHAGSRMFLEPDKPVSVQDLLYGLIVQSGNDAAVALAEAISGTEETFVAQMNSTAKIWGLKDTHFANSHGLPDPGNYSTARDLGNLATHVVQDYPECYKIYATKSFTYNKITQPNRNQLLSADGEIDGIKTGHTAASGYSLIASANRSNGSSGTRRLIAVVLGATSGSARAQESHKLLQWGYQNFDTVKLYGHDAALVTPKVWKGKQNEVKAGFNEDIYVTVRKGQSKKIKQTIAINNPLLAPIAEGSRIGQLKVLVGDTVILSVPIIALANVEQANLFSRLIDSGRLWVGATIDHFIKH